MRGAARPAPPAPPALTLQLSYSLAESTDTPLPSRLRLPLPQSAAASLRGSKLTRDTRLPWRPKPCSPVMAAAPRQVARQRLGRPVLPACRQGRLLSGTSLHDVKEGPPPCRDLDHTVASSQVRRGRRCVQGGPAVATKGGACGSWLAALEQQWQVTTGFWQQPTEIPESFPASVAHLSSPSWAKRDREKTDQSSTSPCHPTRQAVQCTRLPSPNMPTRHADFDRGAEGGVLHGTPRLNICTQRLLPSSDHQVPATLLQVQLHAYGLLQRGSASRHTYSSKIVSRTNVRKGCVCKQRSQGA